MSVQEIEAAITRLSADELSRFSQWFEEYVADGHNIPPDIAQAQIAEVRQRIAQVEAGEVALIPGEEALAHVRRIVASARAAS